VASDIRNLPTASDDCDSEEEVKETSSEIRPSCDRCCLENNNNCSSSNEEIEMLRSEVSALTCLVKELSVKVEKLEALSDQKEESKEKNESKEEGGVVNSSSKQTSQKDKEGPRTFAQVVKSTSSNENHHKTSTHGPSSSKGRKEHTVATDDNKYDVRKKNDVDSRLPEGACNQLPNVLLLHDSVLQKVDSRRLGGSYGFNAASRPVYTIGDVDRVLVETRDTLNPAPDCVVLHVGLNDLKGKDASVCGKQLAEKVRRTKATFPKAHVVVSHAAPVSNNTLDTRRDQFNVTVRAELIDEQNVTLLHHNNLSKSHRYICHDEIHPTAAGASVLAGNVGRHIHRLFWQQPRRRQQRKSPPYHRHFPRYYQPSYFPFPWEY